MHGILCCSNTPKRKVEKFLAINPLSAQTSPYPAASHYYTSRGLSTLWLDLPTNLLLSKNLRLLELPKSLLECTNNSKYTNFVLYYFNNCFVKELFMSQSLNKLSIGDKINEEDL